MSTFKLNVEDAQAGLKDARKRLSAAGLRSLHTRLGKRLEVFLRAHLNELDQQPNKRGWPRTHFWAQLALRTAFLRATEKRAEVAVADPRFAAKVHGAIAKPEKAGGAMAVPLRAEVAGIWARDFTERALFILRSRVLNKAYLAAREGDRLTIYYALLKRVRIPKDPRALPDADKVMAALRSTVTRYFATLNPEEGGANA